MAECADSSDCEYSDTVDWEKLRAKETQLKQKEKELSKLEREVERRKRDLEVDTIKVNQDIHANDQLQQEVNRLKRKIKSWEDEDFLRRKEARKIEAERSQRVEQEIRAEVRIEEEERERVRCDLMKRRKRYKERGRWN